MGEDPGERAGRRRLVGEAAIGDAIARGEPVRLLVVPEAPGDTAVARAIGRAEEAGVPVLRVSEQQFRRLAPASGDARGRALAGDVRALALAGAAPSASAEEVLAADGAAWLLTGTAYPGNAGFAIRTAEASGADGIFIDADFDHAGRREALRVSMRADRFLPVFWDDASRVMEAAARAGRRLVAIEDVGTHAPWEVDLTGRVLFVVGHEREGLTAAALERCDTAIRIPMRGFLRAYNLHAAVAAVAAERLRQTEAEPC